MRLLFAAVGLVFALCIVYLIFRVRGLQPVRRLAGGRKALSWLLAAAPVIAVCVLFALLVNLTSLAVFLLHAVLFWALSDLVLWILKKIRGRPFRHNWAGIVAISVTIVYFGVGWFLGHHVFQTEYQLTTEKSLPGGSLRVALISDSHLGITLDGEEFAEQLERVEAASPDLLVIVGDFVDDDTDREDMLTACQALGNIQTTYGVYFVYGNHDNGYFDYRNFTAQELRGALTENGVTVLEDEALLVDHAFYLIGRRDRSVYGRKSAAELTADLDPSRYMILLDHQPNDYDAEAAAGPDLVLSGHTHGGHIFPAGQIGLAIGANDRIYGTERRRDTDFLVTSGLSGWGIPFKTGTISEYVLIDITSNE